MVFLFRPPGLATSLWAFKLLLSQDPFYNGGIMKRIFNIKLFIAVTFFCFGFLTNHLLVKISQSPSIIHPEEERYPVNPEDFNIAGFSGASTLGMISERQDENNVYYDIPSIGADGSSRKVNVEIKDGMIRINEDVKDQRQGVFETSSERMFTIDPSLDADRAEVINQKDKIVIRIPKK